MWLSKIPNDKNIKSCDQNDETIWSHDLTKIQFRIIKRLIAFEISCGDVDSHVTCDDRQEEKTVPPAAFIRI